MAWDICVFAAATAFFFVLFVQSYRNPRRDAGCWNQSSPDSSGTISMKKSGEVFRGKCRFFLRGHTSVCFYHDFFFLTSLGKSNKKLYLWEPLQILAFTILGHFRCVTSSGLAGLFYHCKSPRWLNNKCCHFPAECAISTDSFLSYSARFVSAVLVLKIHKTALLIVGLLQ